jgi:hypothetical protein
MPIPLRSELFKLRSCSLVFLYRTHPAWMAAWMLTGSMRSGMRGRSWRQGHMIDQ